MRRALALFALLPFAACAPQGESYRDYVNAREGQLANGGSGGVISGPSVAASSIDGVAPAQSYAVESQTTHTVSGPTDRERAAVFAGISDEQSFAAVTSRETIQSDKDRIERNRSRYVQIEPVPVPQRSGSRGPSIVEYALQTSNPVGQKAYDRVNPLRGSLNSSACARYPSPDLAQEAFLRAGGPERDTRSLDPDGDGYACSWDPTPFRSVLR